MLGGSGRLQSKGQKGQKFGLFLALKVQNWPKMENLGIFEISVTRGFQ